jgi:hypothetical protein
MFMSQRKTALPLNILRGWPLLLLLPIKIAVPALLRVK